MRMNNRAEGESEELTNRDSVPRREAGRGGEGQRAAWRLREAQME